MAAVGSSDFSMRLTAESENSCPSRDAGLIRMSGGKIQIAPQQASPVADKRGQLPCQKHDRSHGSDAGDQIPAARHLSLLAGFLPPPRGSFFGLVLVRHNFSVRQMEQFFPESEGFGELVRYRV